MTIDDINWSCPADLEPYAIAYNLEEKKKDQYNWMLGAYIKSAVEVAVEKNLAGKKAKLKYLEKPFYQIAEENQESENLTEEEKIAYTEQFFLKLKVMKSNFELEQRSKNGRLS